MASWSLMRTLVAQAAETDTSNAAGVANAAPSAEFRFASLVATGSPTSVVFSFWREIDGRLDKVCANTVAAADLATMAPLVLGGVELCTLYVTISFVGGTSPALSGTIETRPLKGLVFGRSPADQRAADATEATAARQDVGNASLSVIATNSGTVRHTTTPSKADAATGASEVDKRGVSFVGASLRCRRKVALATAAGPQTAGTAAAGTSLPEGPCDAVRVDTDDTIVYGQPPERDSIVVQTAGGWTAGSGWSFAGTVATHAASGGTATLSQDTSAQHATDPILVNEYYAVLWTISNYVAGTVTAGIGSNQGSARSANGTYLEIIQAQSAVLNFIPTTTFNGAIDVAGVWALPGSLPIKAGGWEPESYIKLACCAALATPGTISSTAKCAAGWYRRAGAVELT